MTLQKIRSDMEWFSNVALSRITGLSVRTITRIRSGENENPNIRTLEKLRFAMNEIAYNILADQGVEIFENSTINPKI